jgi:hypothetical protein
MDRAQLIIVAGTTVALAYMLTRYMQDQQDSEGGDTLPADAPQDNEQTNIISDTVNSIKNIFVPNEIAGVIESGPGYLVVQRPDGTTQRLQGSRNWRNNNPGNIEAGAYARSMGAIGSDGRFAIFPTYDMGRTAKEKLIFEGGNYKALTLSQAINRYAPPSENNTAWYQNTVLGAVGGVDKPMNQYTPGERARILAAMERVEGFKPGTVSNA